MTTNENGTFCCQYLFNNFSRECCDNRFALFGRFLLEKEVSTFKFTEYIDMTIGVINTLMCG